MSELVPLRESEQTVPQYLGTSLFEFKRNTTLSGDQVVYGEDVKINDRVIPLTFFWTAHGALQFARSRFRGDFPLILTPGVGEKLGSSRTWIRVGSVIVPQQTEFRLEFRQYESPDQINWFRSEKPQVLEQDGVEILIPSIPPTPVSKT